MPPKACSSCNRLSTLNAEFYDQRLDLLETSYLCFLAVSLYLDLLQFSKLILPISFLYYTYLRRGPYQKPPDPPPDMAIVRLAGSRAYLRDGSYCELQDRGRSEESEGKGTAKAKERREFGRLCLRCDAAQKREAEESEEYGRIQGRKGHFGSRLKVTVDKIVDWRLPKP